MYVEIDGRTANVFNGRGKLVIIMFSILLFSQFVPVTLAAADGAMDTIELRPQEQGILVSQHLSI